MNAICEMPFDKLSALCMAVVIALVAALSWGWGKTVRDIAESLLLAVIIGATIAAGVGAVLGVGAGIAWLLKWLVC